VQYFLYVETKKIIIIPKKKRKLLLKLSKD